MPSKPPPDRLTDGLSRRLEQLDAQVAVAQSIGDPRRARTDFEYYYQQVFVNVDPIQFPWGAHQHFVMRFITWEGFEGVYPDQKLVVMPPGTGKSNLVSKGLASWLVGKEPDSPTVLATSTSPLAADRSVYLRELVANDPLWKIVFPEVVPYRIGWQNEQWSLIKKGSSRRTSSEPTFRATGADASIGGIRIKYGIIDDAHNNKNARTPGEREKIRDWYHTQWASRFTGMGGGQVMLANIWHGDDLTSNLWDSGQWAVMHMQALFGDSTVYTEVTLPRNLAGAGPELADWCEVSKDRWTWNEKERKLRMIIHQNGPALWPSHEGTEELRKKKKEKGSARFERVWNGNRRTSKGTMYKREWFRYWSENVPPKIKAAHQTWDTASEATSRSDYTGYILHLIGEDGDIYVGDAQHSRLESGMALPLAIACYYLIARTNNVPVTRVLVEASSYARSSIRQIKRGWPRSTFLDMCKTYLGYDDTVPELVSVVRQVMERRDMLPDTIKVPLHAIKITKGGKMEMHEDAVAYYEAGNVHHLAELEELAAFEEEIEDIPGGKNDDMADANAQGVVFHFGVRRSHAGTGDEKSGHMLLNMSPVIAARSRADGMATRRG